MPLHIQLPTTGKIRLRVPAAPKRPGLASIASSERERAQGMPGAGRTRELCVHKKTHFTHASSNRAAKSSGIPCAMVLTVAPRSPWCTGLFSHHRFAKRPAKLDTSVGVSGPHGLAVRLELIRPRAKARLSRNVHRIPHPTLVTIAKRPSRGCRTGQDTHDFCFS